MGSGGIEKGEGEREGREWKGQEGGGWDGINLPHGCLKTLAAL